MKGLEKIRGLTEEQTSTLSKLARDYIRFFRIYIEIVKVKKDVVYVKITDKGKEGSKFLSEDELIERANKLFSGHISEDIKISVIPIPQSANFDHVTPEWIDEQLDEYGMTKIDLAHVLGIKHQNLYRVLGGPRKLGYWHKAAISNYFKSLEK